MTELGRLITAMVTPFDTEMEIDYPQAQRLARALVASRSEGLVVTGTTGENPSLDHEENLRLWTAVKEAVGDTAQVVAGSGTNGTRETVRLAAMAEEAGVDAQLLVVPYYNKPTQEGLYRHFRAVAESTSLPCMLYNVPSRTIVNMTAETTLRLARDVDNVVGVKEASGDLDQIEEIIRGAPDGFRVWSGNDSDTFDVVRLGGWGVVSVASHLVGAQIARLIALAAEGDLDAARAEHERLLPMSTGLFRVSNPMPVKHCLNRAGFDVGSPRLPLLDVDAETAAFLDDLLSGYEVDLPVGAGV